MAENEGAGAGASANAESSTNGSAGAADDKAKNEILADLAKWKKEARDAQAKLKEREESEMKAKAQWEELAKRKEEEANQYKADAERVKTSYLNEKKYSAVREAASRLGLRKEAVSDLDLLSLDGVNIETTSTGKINVLGADSFVEKLKQAKPHWFSSSQPPNVNTSSPRVVEGGGPVTVDMILAAEKEAKKSGDYSKYHQLHKQFRTQPRA